MENQHVQLDSNTATVVPGAVSCMTASDVALLPHAHLAAMAVGQSQEGLDIMHCATALWS